MHRLLFVCLLKSVIMRKTQLLYCIFLFLALLSTTQVQADNENRKLHTLKGRVISATENEPVSFAMVTIEDLNIRTVCDVDGNFRLLKIPTGSHKLQFTCLGYNPKEQTLLIERDVKMTFKMDVTSIALQEIEVMAKRTNREKLEVNEAAIEYVQPTSLADIMLLLPGNIYKESDMSRFGQISSRQVGTDANTSLGVAIMTDGAPVTNDGMRTQLVGVTNNSAERGDSEIRSRTGMNQGTDMRYISTDHIQSIEFTKGISSARYGNLTSGMIQVKSKTGISPLRIRVKGDLKNKLVYAGKGFGLGNRAGTLHAGVDFLNSIDDIREEMDKFTRLTAQAYYKNHLQFDNFYLDLDAKLAQTISMNKMKKDELTYEYNESYKADYSKTDMLLKANLGFNDSWIDKLEFTLSSDVVFDKITRHMMVLSSSGPLSVPLAKEEGEHEGQYLPGKYYSDFYIDNIPVNLFAQVHANSRFQITNPFSIYLQYGLDYKRSKNKGDGAVIADEKLPPFPYDNSYMRPRPNWQIPALSTGAAYLQAEALYGTQMHLFRVSLGGRISHMFNLPTDYALSKRVLAEPRTNLSYTVGKNVKNSFRVGFGMENKLPTLDYLYPEKLYKDFYMLNAFTDEEKYRHLITYTHIFDVANKDILENRNLKFEAGWDFSYKDFEFSVTAFMERSTTGFEYFKEFSSLTYDLYNKLKPGVNINDHVAQKEDYIPEKYSIFTTSSHVMNSKKVIKKGIEYRIIFPKIEPLCTSIELNGAYYKTNYGSSLPSYQYPDRKIADKVFPFVGIYNTDPQNEYRRFNTNIWLNTHIPRFKLIFTNFLQLVWFSSSQYQDSREKYPYALMDLQGNTRPVTPEELQRMNSDDDIIYRSLKRTIYPIEYARNTKPVSLLWNIKATKEFNKYAKLSFFVNGILDINPKYVSGGMTTERDWTNPYFGIELFLNFNL